jgi:hypothetical protein
MKHNIQNASAFATTQLGNKLNKVLHGEGRQAGRNKERQRLNEQDAKTKWYLELVIAACCGAALALTFVIIHQMLTTNWTW